MKMEEKVLKFIQKNGASSIDSIATELNASRQYIHRVISELLGKNLLLKMGTAPHVFYSIDVKPTKNGADIISYDKEQFLNQHFLIIDALGNQMQGLKAMQYWSENQQLPLLKTVEEYIETRKKYLSYFNQEYLIDGLSKLKNTNGIGDIGVDELYYLDFYAIERFGKTYLGCLMHYAKQGQNKQLMQIIVDEIKNRLNNFITQHSIEAVIYVEPTIKRKVQIMNFFEKNLDLGVPKMTVKKISNAIVIPQKALSKLFERVANAKNTFVVPNQKAYKKILILDDAIGSGATINEIALKIKSKKLAKHIIGMSITGSFKGFDVISEL
jgi:AraC-like DNA-binding protein